jgi:two-component system, NarL family, response regulator LiaR
MTRDLVPAARIRVLIADEQRLVIEGVRNALAHVDDIAIVGEAHLERELLPQVARTKPDLVLLGLRGGGVEGLGSIEPLRQRHPDVKVIVLSGSTNREHVQAALQRGAVGYIVKTINPADLPSALREAYEGTVYHALGTSEVAEHAEAKAAGLTEREAAILNAVARGLSNRSIAQELWITEQTVKFHLTNIYRKLGVANRTEATHYAFQHGLVTTSARERQP